MKPFLALTREPERYTSLMEGTTFMLEGVANKTGLVDIQYKGETLCIFLVDVQKYCEVAENHKVVGHDGDL